jgi:hypothetical protein
MRLILVSLSARNPWFNALLITVAVVLACAGLAATSCFAEEVRSAHAGPAAHRTPASEIRTELHRPYDHPLYTVELEPHFVMQWTDLPFRTEVGVGLGFRASIPVLDPGPIPRFNNNLAVSFGVDWAHFGACRIDESDCAGNDVWFPVVMQWNFFLTRWWSVFPEIGIAIHHASWGWRSYEVVDEPGPPAPPGRGGSRPGECGPRSVCEVADDVTEVAFASWIGTRFSLSDTFSFTLRFGYPSLVAGISFRL